MADAKKHNIEQIRKYLSGELDARAMYELERSAHADPFLWDMIKGMEGADDSHIADLKEIDKLITERVEKDRRRIIPLWKPVSIAASLLVALSVGGWYLSRQNTVQPVVATAVKKADIKPHVNNDTLPVVDHPVAPTAGQPIIAKLNTGKAFSAKPALPPAVLASVAPTSVAVQPKKDTIQYIAGSYPVKEKASVDELLRKMPGIDVGTDGLITAQGKAVTKVRLNGKDYAGGDVAMATKNLPADIVDKIQVIDDYGDQASNTGIKDSDPTKVLNIVVRDDGKAKRSIAALEVHKAPSARSKGPDTARLNALALSTPMAIRGNGGLLKEVRLDTAKYSKTLLGKVAGAQVTTLDRKSREAMEQITGRVTDQDSKVGLPGVAVSVPGDKITTRTDASGKFSIAVPNGKDVLDISYVGYYKQQVKVTPHDSLNVTLAPSSNALSEVAVIGYGATKKEAKASISAVPVLGWVAYNKYLIDNATMPDGRTGTVILSFTVSGNGTVRNIRVTSGLADDMNQKAIKLIQSGPFWSPSPNQQPQQVTLNVKFHK